MDNVETLPLLAHPIPPALAWPRQQHDSSKHCRQNPSQSSSHNYSARASLVLRNVYLSTADPGLSMLSYEGLSSCRDSDLRRCDSNIESGQQSVYSVDGIVLVQPWSTARKSKHYPLTLPVGIVPHCRQSSVVEQTRPLTPPCLPPTTVNERSRCTCWTDQRGCWRWTQRWKRYRSRGWRSTGGVGGKGATGWYKPS